MLDSGIDTPFERIFPRVHARALGIAIGVTTGCGLFILTVFHVIAGEEGLPIGLLSQYFYGYDITWSGAIAGAVWAGAAGYVGGWLLGAVHNLTLDLWLLAVRQKTELSQKRNFLDHLR